MAMWFIRKSSYNQTSLYQKHPVSLLSLIAIAMHCAYIDSGLSQERCYSLNNYPTTKWTFDEVIFC